MDAAELRSSRILIASIPIVGLLAILGIWFRLQASPQQTGKPSAPPLPNGSDSTDSSLKAFGNPGSHSDSSQTTRSNASPVPDTLADESTGALRIPEGTEAAGTGDSRRRESLRNRVSNVTSDGLKKLGSVFQTGAPIACLATHPKKASLLASGTDLVHWVLPDENETKDLGGDICIWDLNSGKLHRKVSVGYSGATPLSTVTWGRKGDRHFQGSLYPVIGSIAFHPSDELIAYGTRNGHLMLWDFGSGADPTQLSTYTTGVNSVAFHPDGTMLACANGSERGSLSLFRRIGPNWMEVSTCDFPHPRHVTFSEESGTFYMGTGRNGLWMRDSIDEPFVQKLSIDKEWFASLFSVVPRTSIVVAADQAHVKVFDLSDGKKRKTISLQGITSISSQPIGRCFAIGADDFDVGALVLVDMTDFTFRSLLGVRSGDAFPGYVTAVAFTGDGHLLISGHNDGSIVTWDLDR